MARTTADVLFERLADWGVDTIFGLPGDGINGFMEGLRKIRERIRFIQVRHEEAAAFMACAYAKYTGRLGVCIATSGPGAIHLLNGLYDAKMDGAPVLAITGQTYHDLMGMRYQQEVNLLGLFQDVTVFNQEVNGPMHAHALVDAACRAALGAKGVAHINCYNDWQDKTEVDRSPMAVKGHTSVAWTPPIVVPQAESLARAADLLNSGKKTVIMVRPRGPGGGRRTGEDRRPARGADRQVVAGQGRRARRQPILHGRNRPARHACRPRRRWRNATRSSWSAPASRTWTTCPSLARPRPCRSTATRRGSASATRSTSA